MANLKDLIVNGSARVLGTLYAPDIKNTHRITEFIVGTQTASTGSWTGVTEDTALYDGKTIHYFLPYAGSGNATLNLTLAGGTTTGAKPIYLSGTSYVTTHYGANSCINMTYNSTKGAWFVNADRDNNDVTRLQWSNAIKASTAITANRVIVGTSSGYKNIAASTTFDITYPILYSKSAINAAATGTNNWQSEPGINLANNKSGWTGTNYSVVYLVGTLSGTTFTIDSTMLTTTVPTTEDGKIYTPLGVMYSTTNCYFRPTNQYYVYKNGSFQPYGSNGNIYWATYGTTTFTDIMTAINAGKLVMCSETLGGTSVTYVYRSHTSSSITFYNVYDGGNTLVSVDSSNVWDMSDNTFLPETYRNGNAWYRLYPNGFCEQGSTVNVTTDGIVTVSLLKPMVSYQVFKNYGGAGTTSEFILLDAEGSCFNKTSTSFETLNAVGDTTFFDWHAVGWTR